MGYFDQKFESLRLKLSSTSINDEINNKAHSLPQGFSLENLPFIAFQVIEILEAAIDKMIYLKKGLRS